VTSSNGALDAVPLRVWFPGPKAFCFIDGVINPHPIIDSRNPIGRHILVLVSGPLIRANDLDVPTFYLIHFSNMRAVAIDDRHAFTDEIKQSSSLHLIGSVLRH
jgi:hypothetical protein